MKYYPSLLIASHLDDEHTIDICSHLHSDVHPLILDFSKFGSDYVATIEHNDDRVKIEIRTKDGTQFDLSRIKCVWWRRPQPIGRPSDSDPDRHFAYSERLLFMRSLLSHLKHVVWYNDFDAHRQMDRKSFQLEIARRCGFAIPATCITSSPETAKRFCYSHRKVIFKSFAGSEDFWQPTRLFKADYSELFYSLPSCPVMFQEYIEGAFDYRITCIDDHIFAAEYDLNNTRYQYDVRIDTALKPRRCDVPDGLSEGLSRFMRMSNLRFGAFDFRMSADEKIYFLEINPSGQFLYIDRLCGTEIVKTFARRLSEAAQASDPPDRSSDQVGFRAYNGLSFAALVPNRVSHLVE